MTTHAPTDPVAQADTMRIVAAWLGTFLGAITPHSWTEASAMAAMALTLWILGERLWKRYKRWRAGLPVVPIDEDTGRGAL